jgi:hypothetical protein
MSRNDSTALGVGAALAGAAVAAFVSMGTAHADPADYPVSNDGFEILFGAPGNANLDETAAGLGQIANNVLSDNNLATSSEPDETVLTNDAVAFEGVGSQHALELLVNDILPSSFVTQSTTGIDGYLTGADVGDYLVPDSALGYLATDVDFFLLDPLGLNALLLGPIIETLLGDQVGGF